MIYRQVDLSMTDDTVLVGWTMCQLTSYIVVRIIRIVTCLSVVVTSERSTEFLNWQIQQRRLLSFRKQFHTYIGQRIIPPSLRIFISVVIVLVSSHQSNLSSSVMLKSRRHLRKERNCISGRKFRIHDQSGTAIKELIFVFFLRHSVTFEIPHRTQEYAFLLSRIIGYDSDSNVKI